MATRILDQVGLPGKLSLHGNLDVAWKMFKQAFEIYIVAADLTKAPDEQKIALLLHSAGTQAIELFNSFVLSEEEKKVYSIVVSRFEDYCSPKKNEIFERYVFRCRTQNEAEPVEKFCAELKIMAQTCNFDTLKDSMIRDQLVWGLYDKKVKERLLRAKNLSLEDALSIVQAAEITQTRMAIFSNGGSGEASAIVERIDIVKRSNKQTDERGTKQYERNSRDQGKQKFKCTNCGRQHEYGNCPAYGKRCYKCNKNGHYAYFCKTYEKLTRYGSKSYEKPNINVIKNEDDDMDELRDIVQDFRLDIIETSVRDTGKEKWMVPLRVQGNNEITFKLDTGAETNVLPERVYHKIRPKMEIKKGNIRLSGYNSGVIETMGYISTTIKVKGQVYPIEFAIAKENNQPPILGGEACERLGLVQRIYRLNQDSTTANTFENIIGNYKEIFKGIGCVKQIHNIKIKPQAVPIVQAPRRLAFALRSKVKKELNRLIVKGIIEKVEEPTDWVSSMVIKGKKNGEIRICLDPKNLNLNIRREHFQIPTKDEIMAELAGAKYFSKLDVQNGFHQIPLDKDSSRICTFNTPFGRHCYLRLPFGLASAPEVFQRTMNNIFEGLRGVKVYIDDILIWGRTKEEHDNRLIKTLERAKEAGLTLNREKCEIGIEKLIFLGEEITNKGIRPDKNKVEAIQNMVPPQNKEEVRRMLGLIGYMGKFIPHLSQRTAALRSLTKEGSEWIWEHEHIKEFEEIKVLLSSKPVLEFYDPKRQCKISTDASSYGLGAVLLQLHGELWRPISYAARSLTSTEKQYAQIEKEALGLVYGCERFHDFVYGRKVLLETDHRPLVAMAKKGMADIPPRVQRLFLRLMTYEYDLTFTPGKKLIVADSLSRSVPKQPMMKKDPGEEEIQVHVDLIMQAIPIGDALLERIKVETIKDQQLQEVIKQLAKKRKFQGAATAFRGQQHLINQQDGLLLRGIQVIVPKSMQPEMLAKIHEGHLGIEKNKSRARATVYWPNINEDIAIMSKKCEPCQERQYKKPREPLLQYEIVHQPWYQIGMDLFDHRGRGHIVIMDYHSNYPLVAKLRDMSAASVISCVQSVFSMFGVPYKVITDNGPQFSSNEFRAFAQRYNFIHKTSSPYYPRSNGLAEKAVQIAKRIMDKCKSDNSDVHLGFLAYRSTALGDRASPGELFLGRRLRTTLPGLNYGTATVATHKYKQKYYHDQHAMKNQEYKTDDVVRYLDPSTGRWPQKAIVMEQIAPRSYYMRTEGGRKIRRNSSQIRKTMEPFEPMMEGDLEDVETKTKIVAKEKPELELRRSQRTRRAPERLDL